MYSIFCGVLLGSLFAGLCGIMAANSLNKKLKKKKDNNLDKIIDLLHESICATKKEPKQYLRAEEYVKFFKGKHENWNQGFHIPCMNSIGEFTLVYARVKTVEDKDWIRLREGHRSLHGLDDQGNIRFDPYKRQLFYGMSGFIGFSGISGHSFNTTTDMSIRSFPTVGVLSNSFGD